MFCSASETVRRDGRPECLDCGFARALEVAIAPQVEGERLISFSLFSSDEAAMFRNKRLYSLIECGVEFIPEFLPLSPADAFRIQGVVCHDVVKQENVARKRCENMNGPVGQRNFKVPLRKV